VGGSLDIPADSARSLLEGGPYTGEQAVARGLVDTLVYAADLDSLLQDSLDDDVHTVDFENYLKRSHHQGGGHHIAYVAATGEITSGRSEDRPGEDRVMGSESMVEVLNDVADRSAVKAVVLRVDSPGGVVEPSDEIWRAVERLAASKPVIVSMSDLDASGGYYLSAPATRIVAHPASITGSIGVYGGKFNLVGLMNKVGLSVETLSRGRRASMMSPFTDFTPEEARIFKEHMTSTYRMFLSRVADGRGFSLAWADSVGQGRVWSGASAYELGLADTLGGIETAIALAMQEIGVKDRDDVTIDVYPKIELPWYARFLQDMLDDDTPGMPRVDLPAGARAWIEASSRNAALVLSRMPFDLRIR
jgi:protease-4